ncbi:hypothetical protein SEA_OLICIOUS_65 [Streptomyces phage Olicious]|uniref:Uncharacterized protein n=7 Tax=Immanueltrevirus immanuel3 TaxID=2846399 RepID=A0A2H5BM09_9CAUD|nr:hypothetical protein HWB41_gp34 [Streptomyces phage Immanuel3]AUG87369.1 hypothetical protein SEA_HAUGEANATOR_65 [Streptomyces phage HaugeAnator]AUG87432.1 hypothetical protein SEA_PERCASTROPHE_65 [Streptomyces phage Percastrophe]AUG87497.1 hypothetical protein SEA_ROMERO_65 [Streptomyces phage Romero]AUG87560.1 hypothetical protein SEA_TORITOKI_65 [Streptomyces phage ToriToki]AUG87626.1 hypothetical protein SEA_ZOOBEAR_65 [Streptomyces phage ZooBear]AZF95852.1 hypothetical protein SEA_OLI
MQVTYRIPSKKVPYGFIEVSWKQAGEDMPDPATMAEGYAQFIKTYQAAEVAAFEAAPVKPAAKVPDTSVEDAVKILDEGLGGVEEIDEDAPVKPWNKTEPAATATEEKKPWAAEPGDWDFS